MENYKTIDIMKFVLSFVIITIHVSLFFDANEYLNLFLTNGISRLAVPLYFLTSAFLYYRKNVFLDNESKKKAALNYVKRMLCLILFVFEVFVTYKLSLRKSTDCYLMLLPTAYLIFLWIKNATIDLKLNTVILRRMSTIVFFLHFILIFVCEIIERLLSVTINSIWRFVGVSIFAFLLAYIILKLSNFRKFKWLKNLY